MKRIPLIITAVAAIIAGSVSCDKNDVTPKSSMPLVSMSIIPDFSDGSVYSCSDDGSFFLRVSVTPKTYIDKLINNDGLVCKADFRSVITKAIPENPDFTVVGEIASTSVEEGYLTASFTLAEDELAELQESDYVVSFSLENKDGVHGASTSYVTMDNPRGGQGGDVPGDDVIDLSVNGTANCYIVSNGGSYKFKTVKGNTNESVGEVKGVKVLWETFGTDIAPDVGDLIKADVSYSDGYITFSTNDTYHKGNAVIAAYSDAGCTEGNVLWSWHIWLTDQPIEQKYISVGIYYGTLMDRNLGATSGTPGDVEFLGLLYQWGRKDPFLGTSDINPSYPDSRIPIVPVAQSTINWPSSVETSETVGTMVYVTKHPTTFLTASNGDWSIPKNDNLWKSSKTPYDPCPPGWRVPSSNVMSFIRPDAHGFAYLCYNKSKRIYQLPLNNIDDCYYPVTGYRNGEYLKWMGVDGYYWTCDDEFIQFEDTPSSHEDNPHNLFFYPSETNRRYGYAVRCQKIE